jgi:hypothetical protein
MAKRATPKRKAKAKTKVKAGRAPGLGGESGRVGQVPFVASEAQKQAVMALVAVGTSNKVMADVLRIPERTLNRHFREELKHGRALIHARVAAGITAKALTGDNAAMFFYAKAQMGWRERSSLAFEDAKGNIADPANLFTISITG